MKNNIVIKSIVIALCIAVVAIVGGIFTTTGMSWYESLVKPSQWPPKFLFPIVWSAVYILSFVVMFLMIKNPSKDNKNVFIIFAINGVLNVLWCFVFFGLHQLFLGQVLIVINLILAFILVLKLDKVNTLYFYILAIYPIWLSVATSLNSASWILN